MVDPASTPGQDFHQIASVNLSFPATKVGWEPAQSVLATGDGNGKAELLATTGDVLRIWDLSKDWDAEGRARGGFVGRNNGWTEEYILNARSVLTNVSSLTEFSY